MEVKIISKNNHNSLLIGFTILAYLRSSKKFNPQCIYIILD